MQRGFFVTAKLLVSFLLHFCPERLQLSNLFLQYSVPRICAIVPLMIFALYVWGVYPRSKTEEPKIETKD